MNDLTTTGVGILLIFAVIMFAIFSIGQEQSAYNRLCGGDATWMDAAFAELRVDGSCQ